jgi:hypothetical protein
MQKHILLLVLLAAAFAAQSQDSAKKYVLIEHFTNSNCSTCGAKNPAFYTLINQYPNDIHHLSIHPPIPYSSCALYQANMTENSARTTYYGVFGTPSIALNGELQPITTPLLTTVTLQNYLGETSPLWLEVTESGSGSARTATVKAHSLGSIPAGNYKLYIALAEKTLNYQGTNSETVHHDVFRKMLPDINGTVFNPAASGQSMEFNFNFNIASGWNANEIYVVAWVQNTATKEVLNSGTRFDPIVSGTNDVTPQTIQIQPNPVSETALAHIGDDRAESVEIFAVNGQRVSVIFENQELGQVSIPTATLAAGIYFVKITGEKGVYAAKMAKQ